MFAPVLDDEEDEELRHQNVDVVRVEFAEEMMGVVIIKINTILLLLSLGVAAFSQFSTLEPRYVNTLMWGSQELPHSLEEEEWSWMDNNNQTLSLLLHEDDPPDVMSPSTLLRTFQSITAVLLLSFLRAVIFPNLHRNPDNNATTSTLEAVLADMLFHIQCRLGIGFLACVTPFPFPFIETTVVCLSIALQIASLSV